MHTDKIKISYAPRWSHDGTTYRQTVTVTTTAATLENINTAILDAFQAAEMMKKRGMYPGPALAKLAMCGQLINAGLNMVNITTANYLRAWFNLESNKRYLLGRNTAFNFVVV